MERICSFSDREGGEVLFSRVSQGSFKARGPSEHSVKNLRTVPQGRKEDLGDKHGERSRFKRREGDICRSLDIA